MTATGARAVETGYAAAEVEGSAPARSRRLQQVPGRIQSWFRDEAILVAILVSSFVARWLLADRNSYWVDELYSVAVYGRWNDSAVAAVNNLAENSVHPPLYQFILYQWMDWFGASEVATRSLSNLYVTFATLFLYLLVRDAFSRRPALASAVVFALLHTPLYYALETRSYAQTVFLVTLSSYLLLRMMRTGMDQGWRSALLAPSAALFTLANAAVLLTHYYNGFFWVAQAVVAAAFVLRERAPRQWVVGLSSLAGLYALQGAIFALVWGRVFVDDFRRRSDAYAVDGEVQGPDELLLDQVVTPNLDPPRLIAWTGLAFAAVMFIRVVTVLVRGGGSTRERQRAWTVVYLATWLVLPLIAVFVTFSMFGVERYNLRYFLFSAVPLAPLLVLTVEEAARLAGATWARFLRGNPAATLSGVGIIAVVAFLVLPGTHAAATASKSDWRGMAQRVVDIARADENHDYIVFEASHRDGSMANFYFERYGDDVRVHDVLDINDERSGGHPVLTRDEQVIDRYDHLILFFPHLRTSDFPDALEVLEERYVVRHRQIDGTGRGIVVFDIHPGQR